MVAGLVFIIFIYYTAWCFESRLKIQNVTGKVLKSIYWAAVINYAQLTFLNLAFATQATINQKQTGTWDLVISLCVVKVQ